MKERTYSAQELNQIIGYICRSDSNNGKKQIITRCNNAGLKIEALPTKRGCPNEYIIIEDNFHLEGEEWITCYCNPDWEVSNLGRVRRKSTKKLMGSAQKTDNYLRVCMINESGKTCNKMVNRLIYFSFHPELIENEKKIQIDHINGIRTDNRLSNLRALSAVENSAMRDDNQTKIKTLTTELINRYGYEETEKILQNLLTNS